MVALLVHMEKYSLITSNLQNKITVEVYNPYDFFLSKKKSPVHEGR